MVKKIYLIGFMGVGKSTVGRMLSQRLNVPLLDTDDVFADLHNGMTTGEYITAYGMERFRPEEQLALRSIAFMTQPAVIATGGGVPVYGDNLEIMRQTGVVVHIHVPLESIESRMSPEELSRRPVWATRTHEEVRKLYEERLEIYNKAHYVIDGDRKPETIVDDIFQACLP